MISPIRKICLLAVFERQYVAGITVRINFFLTTGRMPFNFVGIRESQSGKSLIFGCINGDSENGSDVAVGCLARIPVC